MPPRILRFRLRLMRYNPQVQYVPGKHQVTADALSRAPVDLPAQEDKLFVEEVESFAAQTITALPATVNRLQEIREAQKADAECAQVRTYCLQGWPAYMPHQPLLRPYWENRSHIAVYDDLLLYDERIVIPRTMRLDILNCIHTGHFGITKCRARARTSVWWPGLSKQVEDLVTQCVTCAKDLPTPKEPLMVASFPSRPWERIATDLYEYKGQTYIIVVDYYSRWFEIKQLQDETSRSVIKTLKELFATHGIPDLVMSDNGPQYSADCFRQFAATYGFVHTTSSPRYPQANGEVERAVRTAKALLRKNEDVYDALLTYRSTSLLNGLSPSELLMGRRLRTRLPVLPNTLYPNVQSTDRQRVEKKEESYRSDQQYGFNKRHRAQELPELRPGDPVWIRDQDRQGQVLGKTEQPRSYLVKTEKGTVRRNRSALVTTKDHVTERDMDEEPPVPISVSPTHESLSLQSADSDTSTSVPDVPVDPPSTPTQVTRSGRMVKPPERLNL